MMQKTNNKQLIEAAHLAAKYLPPASAQLMVELATRLDVQTILRNEARAEGVAAMRDTYHRLSKACEALGKAEESVFHDAVVDACDQWLREGKAGEVCGD